MSVDNRPQELALEGGARQLPGRGRGRVTLGVFGKHWTPGATKTRLAASLGADHAAIASRLFLEATLERLSRCQRVGERVLAYAPVDQAGAFAELPAVAQGDWRLEAQAEGDLGARMRAFFENASQGQDAGVLVGSDSPHLPLDALQYAIDWLGEPGSSRRLVLGPATDGGYWLIGVRGPSPPIFDAMPWSDSDLLRATLRRLVEAGWREGPDYRLAPRWYDIDEATDLERMRRGLADRDGPLLRLADQLDRLLGPL